MRAPLFLIVSLSLLFANCSNKFHPIRVSGYVKKEAKKYEKNGWLVFSGALPIEQQLNDSYLKQREKVDKNPKWIIANGSAIGETLGSCEMQANEIALINLSSALGTEMRKIANTDLINDQLSKEEVVSISKTITVATNKVAKKIEASTTLFKLYKENKKYYEVQVQIAYNYNNAIKLLLEEIKNNLENNKNILDKLDKINVNLNL